MNRFFFVVAAIFFFLAAAGATVLPNETAWGLVCLAIGLAAGDWRPWDRRPIT